MQVSSSVFLLFLFYNIQYLFLFRICSTFPLLLHYYQLYNLLEEINPRTNTCTSQINVSRGYASQFLSFFCPFYCVFFHFIISIVFSIPFLLPFFFCMHVLSEPCIFLWTFHIHSCKFLVDLFFFSYNERTSFLLPWTRTLPYSAMHSLMDIKQLILCRRTYRYIVVNM